MSGLTAADIARALGGRKPAGYWTAKCPAHDDHSPSLSISESSDGTRPGEMLQRLRARRRDRRAARPRAVAGTEERRATNPGARTSKLTAPGGDESRRSTTPSAIASAALGRDARPARHLGRGLSRLAQAAPAGRSRDPAAHLALSSGLPVPRQDEGDRRSSPPSRRSGPRCRTIPSSIRRPARSIAFAAAATTTRPCSAR